jgi:hypothetical protein
MIRRTGRQRKPRTIWQEKRAPLKSKDLKISKKAARTAEKTALKPIATGPLLEEADLNINYLSKLSIY